MCTAFFRKGNDVITGFNFDMNEGYLSYAPIIEKDRVMVSMRFPQEFVDTLPPGVKMKNCVRLIQGVSSGGYAAGQLGNMDFFKLPSAFEENMLTIDQLTDDFVTERYSRERLMSELETHDVTNIPNAPDNPTPPLALHSLFVDPEGNAVFVEPGNGYAVIKEKYFTVTNFSVLEPPLDLNDDKCGYYGVDRYRKSVTRLKNSGDDFSAADGLALLNEVRQTGDWATRFSFVYSLRENAVYYCFDGDFGSVQVHRFDE